MKLIYNSICVTDYYCIGYLIKVFLTFKKLVLKSIKYKLFLIKNKYY